MDFFTSLIDLLGAGVVLLGIFVGAIGGIQYGSAHSSDDAQKKSKSTDMIVGGIIIAAVGIIIWPLIKTYFPTI